MSSVLITGGAGFIGIRLAARLAGAGHAVRILDNLHPQVHGEGARPPALPAGVAFTRGDVRDAVAVRACVEACAPEVVCHLAAETGTGQSQDEVSRYCDVNVMGTAVVLEALRAARPAGGLLVLASSRAVYGEGPCLDAEGRRVVPGPRDPARMRAGAFDPVDARGAVLRPVPANAGDAPSPCSVYAATKLAQEQLVRCATQGGAWRAAILRFQNVYGPGQSLRNPYTGVLSIFCAQALRGERLNIFEDGRIVRDFVFVDDVVEALALACARPQAAGRVIDIGTGRAVTIREAAETVLAALGRGRDALRVSGDFRVGDIRHAVADAGEAASVLGWTPRVTVEEGIARLAAWVRSQQPPAAPGLSGATVG